MSKVDKIVEKNLNEAYFSNPKVSRVISKLIDSNMFEDVIAALLDYIDNTEGDNPAWSGIYDLLSKIYNNVLNI